MIVLLVDSREQLELEFDESRFDRMIVRALPVADYAAEINGKMIPIMVERKAMGDLFKTMTHDYDRFKREMKRAKELGIFLVLAIEGSLDDVKKGYEFSQYSGDSMLKKLAMLRVKYDLETHFFNSRKEMARWIEELFLAVDRFWKATAPEVSSTATSGSKTPSHHSSPGEMGEIIPT